MIQAVVTYLKMCLSLNSGSKCPHHIHKTKIVLWNYCLWPPRGCVSQHIHHYWT